MNLIKKYIFILFGVCAGFIAQAQHVAVFCGGEMYHNIEKNATTMKLSGFNTVIFWSVHIHQNGSLILNDSEIIVKGEYVGIESWPKEIAKLKEQPTSVNRIELSVGAWSVPDFENIEALIAKEGVGENSTLYRNFKKLKEITGADAIDFDDESNYDVPSTVTFSEMLIQLGYKITLCPYKNKTFWQSVYNQVRAKHPNAIDRIYLQCYAGGASNTPAAWNDLFAGLDVSPGLWCSNGTNCIDGQDWHSVKNKLDVWKSSGIDGAFIWVFDDILKCPIGGTTENYATAIRDVFGIKTIAPGKAYQPKPLDFSKEVSVDQNLKWIPGSFDAKHKVYLGTDSVLTENYLLGIAPKSEFEPGTLKNNSVYYWRIDEFNNAATIKGDLWRFTTEVVTVPAEKARLVQPANKAVNIDARQVTLLWSSGKGTVSHKVCFGSENPPPFIQEQTDTIFKPEKLKSKTTYYWRIDETNSVGTSVGDVWSFTTQGGNIAPEATISVSTEYPDSNFGKNKIVDGIVGIHGQGEWASNGQTTPWVKLSWEKTKKINKIILYDRANSVDLIKTGTLSFSDGSTIEVKALPNEGGPLEIIFSEKTVVWVKFQVNTGSGANVGLAEFEVYEAEVFSGTQRVQNNKFSVYPNPTSDGKFYLNIPSTGWFQLFIHNSSGELVKSMNKYKSNEMVDIKNLPHGLYMLSVLGTEKRFKSKILFLSIG